MPAQLAISALGGLSCNIMTSSRLCFVGVTNGHFPDCLSLVTKDRLTPALALVFLGILSLAYLCTSDIYRLFDYASFVESMFVLLCCKSSLPPLHPPRPSSSHQSQFGHPSLVSPHLHVPVVSASLCEASRGE